MENGNASYSAREFISTKLHISLDFHSGLTGANGTDIFPYHAPHPQLELGRQYDKWFALFLHLHTQSPHLISDQLMLYHEVYVLVDVILFYEKYSVGISHSRQQFGFIFDHINFRLI